MKFGLFFLVQLDAWQRKMVVEDGKEKFPGQELVGMHTAGQVRAEHPSCAENVLGNSRPPTMKKEENVMLSGVRPNSFALRQKRYLNFLP